MSKREKKILIIDDEPVRRSIEEAFRRSSSFIYDTTVARNVMEVHKEKLLSLEWDVMIIDLQLLDSVDEIYSGFFLVPRVEHPKTLTVVYSAYGDPENLARATFLGANLFLNKHYKPSELVKIIDLIFTEHDRQRDQEERMKPILDLYGEEWQREHAGECVAIVGNEIIAYGPTRLALAIDLDKYRQTHPDLIEKPYIIDMLKRGVK